MKGILCPGLPHLLHPEKSPAWSVLNEAMTALRKRVEEYAPDVIVVCSSQWMSVLGVSFLAVPNPKGVHVDENWYEYGDLDFDFKVDAALSERVAASVGEKGIPTKTVSVHGFPIDTGTIVALRYLNKKSAPVIGVSSWVYADAAKSREIGRLVKNEVLATHKRPLFLAVSGLTARFSTEEIDPKADKISNSKDIQFLARFSELLKTRDLAGACALVVGQGAEIPLDMQGAAIHWLNGALGDTVTAVTVFGEGPIWGTANIIAEISGENL